MSGVLYVWGKKSAHILKDGIALCEVNISRCTNDSFTRPDRKICKNCDNIHSGKVKKKKKSKAKIKKKKQRNFAQRYDFYTSRPWLELRYRVLAVNDGCCELCGRSKHEGVILHVDHIKPRSKHPELALSFNNMQVLCAACNYGKSNKDDTDWRSPRLAVLMGEEME